MKLASLVPGRILQKAEKMCKATKFAVKYLFVNRFSMWANIIYEEMLSYCKSVHIIKSLSPICQSIKIIEQDTKVRKVMHKW